jgi:aldose 1-epimerase
MLLRSSHFLPVDENLIPTGELAPVSGTPFDFTEAHIISERIDTPGDEQLLIAGGYDHCWVVDSPGDPDGTADWIARVIDPGSGRVLDVRTDQPGVQFYTGNFLDGSFAGTSGSVYGHRSGFCLETQHFPDSPNQPSFPTTVLRPGEVFRSRTTFSFAVPSSVG